jgi:hypothetical protein
MMMKLKDILDETLNEEKVYIDFLNKKKGFKQDRIKFNSYEDAVKWAKKNFEKFSPDMIKFESINEENEPTNPELWDKAIAAAKRKYDVYPSAYANAFASKWYKEKGGDWKTKKESVNELKLNDLVGNQYKYVIGSGEEKYIGENDKKYVLEMIEKSLKTYLYDDDFALNYLDGSQRREYNLFFEKEVLTPMLKKIDFTLNNFFVLDKDKVKWKLSSNDTRKMIDEIFRKNSKVPSDIKKEYYEYRLEYAGVKLKESVNESAKSEKLAGLISKTIERVDSSLSYKDFAMAVGKIIKDEYGSHLYTVFVQELKKELNRENESIKLTTLLPVSEALTISIKNILNDLVPKDIQNATTPQQMERRTSFIRDLVKTLNYFYKQNRVDWRFADSNLKFKMYSKD